MTKDKKLLKRLLSKPKDFTYNELKSLLLSLGYSENNTGKTSGSAIRFISKNKHIIRLHKPHPSPLLKSYVIDMVLKELIKEGFYDE